MAVLIFMTHACALDRLRISGHLCRGVCVAERFATHPRGLKRTWDRKLSSGLMSSQLNVVTTDLLLLTLMTITSYSAAVQIQSSIS